MGYVSDEHRMADIYNACDAFLMPSLQDNLPNTIVEAMASGLPCIATAVGGIPQMIHHLENGYLAEPRQADDLCRGLEWLFTCNYSMVSKAVTLTQTVLTKRVEQATGGINDTLLHAIPTHANGGALSGIVTRATLTNQGWVGEDGAEALLRMGHQTAVVPLTNTRYVRPFAQAVASEMNGGNQNVVHNHYQIGSVSVPEGSGAARAMEMLVHELKMARSA